MNEAKQALRQFIEELADDGVTDFDSLTEDQQDKAASLLIVDWACDKALRNSVWEFVTEGDQALPVYLAGYMSGGDPARLLDALKSGARDYARKFIDDELEGEIDARRDPEPEDRRDYDIDRKMEDAA